MIHAYKTNILFRPKDKQKIIGDTSSKYLYGEVLDVGDDVKGIKKGDTIYYTQWGTNKVIKADGTEDYYISDNADFILGVEKNEV